MPDFLQIPGNIRQQYMPFTISGPGKKQVFSFKDVKEKKYQNPCQIHPFSRHFATLLENDSGIYYTHDPSGQKKVTLEKFLDMIPAIQIREYVPDAKLTQTFKWFSYFKRGFDAGLQNIDSKSLSFENIKTEIKNVMDNIGTKMKRLTSGDTSLLKDVVGRLAYYYQDKGYNIGDDNGFAVLFLPFILYYKLTTTNTNNVYEIPYSMQNEIMKSDGTYGWSGSNGSDFGILDKAGKAISESPITKLLLGNTVKVNMMPSFQPTGETKGETFTINIDLINDSDEAAVNNFLMCHTLFGNNRWLQYGFVQTGASLYDVKFPGANRYFMCSGTFSCKGKGVFRTPSVNVCNALLGSIQAEKTFSKVLNDDNKLKQALINERALTITDELGGMEESDSSTTEQLPNLEQSSETSKRNARDPSPSSEELSQFQKRVKAGVDISAKMAESKDSSMEIRSLSKAAKENYNISDVKNLTTEYKNALTDLNKKTEVYDNAVDSIIRQQNKLAPIETSKKVMDKLEKEKGADSAEYIAAKERYEQTVKEVTGKENLRDAEAEAKKMKDILEGDITTLNSEDGPKAQKEAAEKTVSEKRSNLASKVDAKADIDAMYGTAATAVTNEDLQKLIKIPDVYSLTLTFNSLLPDNFNNYLYGFRAANLDPIDNYARGAVDETGVFEKLVQQLEEAMK